MRKFSPPLSLFYALEHTCSVSLYWNVYASDEISHLSSEWEERSWVLNLLNLPGIPTPSVQLKTWSSLQLHNSPWSGGKGDRLSHSHQLPRPLVHQTSILLTAPEGLEVSWCFEGSKTAIASSWTPFGPTSKVFPQMGTNGSNQIQISFSPKIPNKDHFIPETMYVAPQSSSAWVNMRQLWMKTSNSFSWGKS